LIVHLNKEAILEALCTIAAGSLEQKRENYKYNMKARIIQLKYKKYKLDKLLS
jgi:hypothetical protein